MNYPRECCNSDCRNIFFVSNPSVFLVTVCEKCQEKQEEKYER